MLVSEARHREEEAGADSDTSMTRQRARSLGPCKCISDKGHLYVFLSHDLFYFSTINFWMKIL